MKITEQEMLERRQVADLQSAITDAIGTVAQKHGSLPIVVVALACSEVCSRWLRWEMRDETEA